MRQITLCCGKLYHELDERRRALGRKDVALIRIEQLYPFHREMLREILAGYPASAERVFAQEEPRNMGSYLFIADEMEIYLGEKRPRYISAWRRRAPRWA